MPLCKGVKGGVLGGKGAECLVAEWNGVRVPFFFPFEVGQG